MWVTPTSGSTSCGRPASSSADESCKVCAATTLSSASPWISSNGRRSVGGVGEQRAGVVGLGAIGRIAEIPLGVVRVVQAPLGDGRTGDRRVEHVGSAEHGQRREVAAETPAADGDSVEVEPGNSFGDSVQGVDLVVERRPGEISVDGSLPLAAAPGCAATVGDDDHESLVGEPLRGQVGVVRLRDAQRMRSAVRVEQHGQRGPS